MWYDEGGEEVTAVWDNANSRFTSANSRADLINGKNNNSYLNEKDIPGLLETDPDSKFKTKMTKEEREQKENAEK